MSSTGGVTALGLSSDASRIAIATEGAISLVEPELAGHGPYDLGAEPGGPITEPMTGISGETGFLVFVGSGQRLVSSSGSLLSLWDPNQDARIATVLPVHLPDPSMAGDTPGLAIARDGHVVAWASKEPEVGIWDPVSGRRTLRLPPGLVSYDSVALSSDGAYAVAAGSQGVQIWDLARLNDPVSVPSSSTVADSVDAVEPDTAPDSMLAVWDNGRIDRLSLSAAELQRLAPPGNGDDMSDVEVVPEAGLAFEVIDGHLSQIDLSSGRRTSGRSWVFPPFPRSRCRATVSCWSPRTVRRAPCSGTCARGNRPGALPLAGSPTSPSARMPDSWQP